MLRILIKWLINIIALFVVINTISGVSVTNSESLAIAALIIGLLNAFLRPVLILITMPFSVLTLGIFTLVINAFMFYLASIFVPGFKVINFWSAFCAGLLFSFISFILNLILSPAPAVNMSFRMTGFNSAKRETYNNGIDNVIDVEGKVVDDTNKGDKRE